MRQVFTNRSFVFLWSAGLCAQFAWWMLHTSMLVLVFERTGSAFATGLIPVFSSLPTILLGPIAGRIVDRWDRKRVMEIGSLTLAVLMAISLPIANDAPVAFLYAFIVVQSVVMTVMTPAENSLLPTLVQADQLKTANALNVLNDGLGRIVGPAIGSVILVQLGFAATVAVSLVIFVAAWGFLVGMRTPAEVRQGHGTAWGAPFREQIALVVQVLAGRGVLAVVVIVFALYMVADVPLSAISSAFFGESLHASPEQFGFMLSLRGVAGILGGLLILVVSRWLSEKTLLVGGLLMYGFAIAYLGVVNTYGIGLLGLILVGPAAAAIQTGMNSLLQRHAPPEISGSIFALVGSIGATIALVVSITAGSVAEVTGTRAVVIASGCLEVLPALVALRRLPSASRSPRAVASNAMP
jgi:MFS family permease